MNITDQAVEMIAWFNSKGEIHPIRFRLTDQSAKTFVVSVKKILDRRLERHSGSYFAVFDCVSSSTKNQEKSYRLKYEMTSCKWYLGAEK